MPDFEWQTCDSEDEWRANQQATQMAVSTITGGGDPYEPGGVGGLCWWR